MIPGRLPDSAAAGAVDLDGGDEPCRRRRTTLARMPITLDLSFLGRAHVIATAALPCDGGVALVDPGPSSCLPALTAALAAHGYALTDVKALLLTHIHLDHAGAAGSIVQQLPDVPVYVHAVGARHLIAPEKLLASATRLYGADMNRLWGAFLAVPEANVRALTGGETITPGGLSLAVASTPGHAVHHVSYLDAADGIAYVGDTAGIAIGGYALAATPPPDVDLGAWMQSLDAIDEWAPRALFLTHFGEVAEARAHLARYRQVLLRSAERVRTDVARGGDERALIEGWVQWLRADARAALSEADAQAVEVAAPFDQIWQGLARYWRKRAERDGAAAIATPFG